MDTMHLHEKYASCRMEKQKNCIFSDLLFVFVYKTKRSVMVLSLLQINLFYINN